MDTQAILKQMTQNFPRWMDVRKRNASSNGGLLLQSIASEFDNVNKAIEEYRNDYFLVRLIGREDEIIDYLWSVHVGEFDDITDVVLTSPALTITTDEQAFLQNRSSLCFYTEGYLLFTKEAIGNLDKVSYTVDEEYDYVTAANKTQIWNLFDEFAMFSGLTRRDGETNKELVKRIMLVYSRPANSSEQGLKNAILNSLPEGVNLAENDIVFDTAGASSLTVTDDEYGTLYERLAQLNKDTWRTKEWSKTDWEHAFKELEYLPNVWDAEPVLYQNGTGRYDDLQVGFTSELGNEKTDVEVYTYERSNVRIQDYIRNNTIEEEIPLTLTKYSDGLTAKDVQFKIEASEAMDILHEPIKIESCKQVYGTTDHYVEDLLFNETDASSFTIQDMGKLNANTSYKLQFRPQSGFDSMKIASCKLNDVSILTEQAPYRFINGILTNTDVLLHQESISEIKEYTNLKDTLNGFTLDDAAYNGKAVIDLDNIGGQYLIIKTSCRQTTITNDAEFVTANGFIAQQDGSLLSNDAAENCDLTITGKMSTLSLTMTSGNCLLTKTINGKTTNENIYEAGTYEYEFGNSADVTFKIKRSGAQPLRISKIAYACYNITTSLKNGELRVLPGLGTVLPTASAGNELYINIQAFSSFAPVIEYVHVGSDLSNAVYELPLSTTAAAELSIETNCIVTLIDITNNTSVSPYVTKKTYVNNTGSALPLKIDTAGFSAIESSVPEILTSSFGGQTTSYISVEAGQSIQKITITGTSAGRKQLLNLTDIIDTTGCTNLYVSKALDGIVKRTAAVDTLIAISKDMLHPDADYFRITCPDTVGWAFIMADGTRVYDNDCDRSFTSITFFPKASNEYIAYNTVTMVQEEVKSQNIVELFHPPLPATLTAWKVSTPVAKADVKFSYGTPRDWSIGKHAVDVLMDMSLDEEGSYNCTKINITNTFKISDTIELDETIAGNGGQLKLAEYIIKTPDYLQLNYENREYEETIVAETDGFNKLSFANIVAIASVSGCALTDLELIKDAGIIHWLTSAVQGNTVTVHYTYKAPVSMTYIDMEHLYSLAGYSIDAYSLVNGYPKMFTNVADGRLLLMDTGSNKKIVAKCSNGNFGYAIENGGIRIIKTNNENVVYVQGGTYYCDGQEHYLHASVSSELFEDMGMVILGNVNRTDSQFLFHERSTNYLENASMTAGRKAEACIVDFTEHKEMDGISSLQDITACDTFAGWQEFGMHVAFVPALNGLGISFSKEHKYGYAFLDITAQAIPGKMISVWTNGMVPLIAFEDLVDEESLGARAASLKDGSPMNVADGYCSYTFGETNSRTYLLVKEAGTIDDIIIADPSNEHASELHTRVTTRFGFDAEEKADTGALKTFVIENTGNRYSGTDMMADKTIMTSTNADWGFTKVYELRDDFSGCKTDGNRMAGYVTSDDAGFLTTPRFFIPNKQAVRKMVVKINDVHDAAMTRISCYTADDNNEEAVVVTSARNTNMLVVENCASLLNYIEIKVDMPASAVILSVEAYVEYVETNQPLCITAQNYGELETKLYDLGYEGSLIASKVVLNEAAELDQIVLQVRGCRKTDKDLVWTEWKQISFDENGTITNPPSFEGYQFFCFKLALHSPTAKIQIDRIEFEVN